MKILRYVDDRGQIYRSRILWFFDRVNLCYMDNYLPLNSREAYRVWSVSGRKRIHFEVRIRDYGRLVLSSGKNNTVKRVVAFVIPGCLSAWVYHGRERDSFRRWRRTENILRNKYITTPRMKISAPTNENGEK